MSKNFHHITLIAIFTAIALQMSCDKSSEKVAPEMSSQPKVKSVEIMKVSRGEIRSELDLSGTIKAKSRITVFPRSTGKILALHVDNGSNVSKGEILAVVEHEELELRLRQSEVAHRAAKSRYEQTLKLAKIRIESQVSQAKAKLSAAETSLQQVLDLAETRTIAQIEQSEAGLVSLRENLKKLREGARDEDRKRAKASVVQAEASLANAQSDYDRMKKLFENGAVSGQVFDGIATKLEVAKAQYDMAIEREKVVDKGARKEELRSMEAQVRQAEANVKLARVSVETRSWEKEIALARTQVEMAEVALRLVEASVDAESWNSEIIVAENLMMQAKTALDLAKKAVADATITAPIGGIISRRNLELGAMASPNIAIFEIVELSSVKAVVSVIESELAKVAIGKRATVSVDASNELFNGKVTKIDPILDMASRSVKVEISIDNSNFTLKPGMFARVTIPIEVRKNVILIDRVALVEVAGHHSVFIVNSGKSQKRAVTLGLSQGDKTEVVKGLSEGETIVVAGQHSLKEGELLRFVND